MPVVEHTRRWADWNRHSAGSGDCRADYFSVPHKPKIRVDLSTSKSEPQQRPVVDIHVTVNNRKKHPPPDVTQSSWQQQTTMAILVAFVTFIWYKRRRVWIWICSNNKPAKNADKISQSDSSSSSALSTTATNTNTNDQHHLHSSSTASLAPNLVSEEERVLLSSLSMDDKDADLNAQSSLPPKNESTEEPNCSSPEDDNKMAIHKLMAREQNVTNCQISSVTLAETTTATPTALLDIPLVQQRAQEMTAALAVAQTCLQQAGMQVDAKHLIPWITQQQVAAVQRIDQQHAQARQCALQAAENEQNRQHTAAVHGQEAQWMERIKTGCDELVQQVERTALQVLFLEACLQAAAWLQNSVGDPSSSLDGIGRMIANVLCDSTCRDQPQGALGLAFALSSSTTALVPTCWMLCAGRLVLWMCGGYVIMQCRCVLPSFVREAFATMALGTACALAVSNGLVPVYWYIIVGLQIFCYLAAHGQFFCIKKHFQSAFPGKNPTSLSVNQSLDGLETCRRCYAMLPVVFATAHAARLAWTANHGYTDDWTPLSTNHHEYS